MLRASPRQVISLGLSAEPPDALGPRSIMTIWIRDDGDGGRIVIPRETSVNEDRAGGLVVWWVVFFGLKSGGVCGVGAELVAVCSLQALSSPFLALSLSLFFCGVLKLEAGGEVFWGDLLVNGRASKSS